MIRTSLRRALLVALVAAVSVPAAPAAGAVVVGDIAGRLRQVTAGQEDTLVGLAQRHGLGFVEIVAANPDVDRWLPGAGRKIVLPTAHLLPDAPREGIVINLAELRLYYFDPGSNGVATYPLGIGKAGYETPLGQTRVVRKREQPHWIPPPSVRADHPELPKVVEPGPHNPLGAFALDLGWPSYLIHGTNEPAGIGRRVSYGCIRLYPRHIARLYEAVSVDTPVTVVDQSIKIGWSAGQLYLEVHPTQSQVDEIEAKGRFTPQPVTDLAGRLKAAAGADAKRLDWWAVHRALRERRGIPVQVTR